jgi:hypothetical protein
MRRHLLLLITFALLVLPAAACNDDDGEVQTATTERSDSNGASGTKPDDTEPDDTKGSGGGGDEALCEALEPVRDSNEAVAELSSYAERREYLLDNFPELNDAYDEAIDATEDAEMKSNLETLREYNDEFRELLEQNDTEAELTAALAGTDTSDVEQAGLDLNLFTTDECGFAVSG